MNRGIYGFGKTSTCTWCLRHIYRHPRPGERLPIKDGVLRFHPDCHETYLANQPKSVGPKARVSDLYPPEG